MDYHVGQVSVTSWINFLVSCGQSQGVAIFYQPWLQAYDGRGSQYIRRATSPPRTSSTWFLARGRPDVTFTSISIFTFLDVLAGLAGNLGHQHRFKQLVNRWLSRRLPFPVRPGHEQTWTGSAPLSLFAPLVPHSTITIEPRPSISASELGKLGKLDRAGRTGPRAGCRM